MQAARRLAAEGLRVTAQRREVVRVLGRGGDHPTADEVYLRVRERRGDVAMATVYNTLDALVKCGILRQVKLDRAAVRYCPNMREHAHFYCEDCGRVFDIELDGGELSSVLRMPRHLAPGRIDVVMRGHCLGCPRKAKLATAGGSAG